ncbi:serine/threonine/dual specificity protein kinase, catalytic domain-containing protein [Artemisia annua]|uniref:Serine/threonine/dual specificity protein kinase, catalytic domain-containing protein n=1 Tax=Artemisia annua TaxID=35608 RepID=A0A2U1LUR8_ARTAN|nr:serine/threonine/dual specificity protein kinase, catalytic domain-containing protein [Artemisia annua]
MLHATVKETDSSFLVPDTICQRFSLEEIRLATQNFNEALVIGRGGFGMVYKGNTNHGSATDVAIKRLHSLSNQGAPEFQAEVEMLSRIRHCNLVSLIGYCKEDEEMALVYEYMPHGTLEDHLHKGGVSLSWLQRLKICIGAARGFYYLHTGTGTQHGIIHRDVKSSNILLDKNFAAKISDFGLAKISPTNQTCTYVSTLVKGTFGYMDPCYFTTGKLTRKSDVYSFGVLLLEVICGRPAVDTSLHEDQWSLANWAQDRIKQGKLNHIIDSRLEGQISRSCQKELARIVCRCLHNQPNQRPTMAEIVSTLVVIVSMQERLDSSVTEGKFVDKVLSFFSAKVDSQASNLGSEGESSDEPGNVTYVPVPQSPDQSPRNQLNSSHSVNLKSFTFSVIKTATRNFRPPAVVGEHIYSSLYKGWIDGQYAPARPGTGLPIAVKRLNHSLQGHQEWLAEIKNLGLLNHPNLVKLYGYCLEEDHRMLVCEFMSGGYLGKHLFKESSYTRPLSWSQRIKVALDTANALAYLHSQEAKLVHHDFKSSSILLDSLAKDGPVDGNSHVSTRVVGTNGYAAPECIDTGDSNVTSDIYTFGVVLLEILTGRRCIDKKLPPDEQMLVEFAKFYLKNERRVLKIIDMEINGQYSSAVAIRASKLAMKCLLDEPKLRPTAAELVKELEQLQVQQPV